MSTIEERVLEKLKKAALNRDAEVAHYDADQALCELLEEIGYHEVVKAWGNVRKWYS